MRIGMIYASTKYTDANTEYKCGYGCDCVMQVQMQIRVRIRSRTYAWYDKRAIAPNSGIKVNLDKTRRFAKSKTTTTIILPHR